MAKILVLEAGTLRCEIVFLKVIYRLS